MAVQDAVTAQKPICTALARALGSANGWSVYVTNPGQEGRKYHLTFHGLPDTLHQAMHQALESHGIAYARNGYNAEEASVFVTSVDEALRQFNPDMVSPEISNTVLDIKDEMQAFLGHSGKGR